MKLMERLRARAEARRRRRAERTAQTAGDAGMREAVRAVQDRLMDGARENRRPRTGA